MASFLLSEVYIVEKVLSAGHPDLDDLTCEATVCTSLQQAHCEAIRSMVSAALEKNCDREEEESLRYELVKTMRRRGVTPEKRYQTLKEIIINASRVFGAEKTYYTVKRSAIVPHREYDEETMVADALKLLEETEPEKADDAAGSSGRNARSQAPRDLSLRGRGRVSPALPRNEEGLSRKRAREHKH